MTDTTISKLATPKQGPLLFAGLFLAHLPLVGYVSRASKRSIRALGSMALPFGGYDPLWFQLVFHLYVRVLRHT